jgi:hypothetical protein
LAVGFGDQPEAMRITTTESGIRMIAQRSLSKRLPNLAFGSAGANPKDFVEVHWKCRATSL